VTQPAFTPRHCHTGSGPIEIAVQKTTGKVLGVWFGNRSLPFRVRWDFSHGTATPENPAREIAIEEITYVDLEEERSQ
jgi:hypothetical protein